MRLVPADIDRGLRRLAQSSYAYFQGPGWGWNNSGLVASGNHAMVIDTCYTLSLTRTQLAAIDHAVPNAAIDSLVLTHLNGDHAFGAGLLPQARLVTSATAAASLEHEVTPQQMSWLATQCPDAPTRDYTSTHFGCFDFTGASLRIPDQTFTGRLEMAVGSVSVVLIEVGPAHSEGDLIVHVPDDDVVFAGDVVFVGDHPIAWASPSGLVTACDRILSTGATIVVPGHGPVAGRDQVMHLRNYYEYVLAEAGRRFDAGMPYQDAAREMSVPGFVEWGLPERLVITVEACYRELGAVPAGMPAILGQVARAARRAARSGTSQAVM